MDNSNETKTAKWNGNKATYFKFMATLRSKLRTNEVYWTMDPRTIHLTKPMLLYDRQGTR
jgi:hypothetical protein